mmetsp:Transcript_13166/g.22282  ORF Transcript_13166/g.22282 Transcript_13166/m.22282 type:complete len:229 (-) Transcript_13166:455-1141(-)|eukprot:CAMPEP_0198210050 /NCGR_PEP_ID=MMETSP1445-20131203/18853_1 /TAXON_ID=36898 /ORGANISM="Pyramimonas sp., Strain CCMP2087" /LENGTH=228 /DNA_ID=CAMNT_0043884005 /DNA_START=77 /DNA_END=763 /DNA_ORIENTATION=+
MASLAQQAFCTTGRILDCTTRKTSSAPRNAKFVIRAQQTPPHGGEEDVHSPALYLPRRAAVQSAVIASAAAAMSVFPSPSLATPPRKKVEKIDPALYTELPGTNPPIKYYDLKIKDGTENDEGANPGQRVAVHFDVKYRGLTIATSRQGAGVTGGVPYGFNVGIKPGDPGGPILAAFNEGIKGMAVGTVRTMIVPPEYGYGKSQVQEIPPNATLQLDLELLSIKRSSF